MHNTIDLDNRQALNRINRRFGDRLLQTKERLRLKNMAALQSRERHTKIEFSLGSDVVQRARIVCQKTEGLDLVTILRQHVIAYAEELPAGRRLPPKPSEEDQEWEALITELGESVDPGDGLTVTEILDCLDWPEAARNRSALMRVGRIMKRLRWGRCQVERDGRRVWIYRKPLAP